jgi:hypothetical protein
VLSQNSAIKAGSIWPKEDKVCVPMYMQADAALLHAAYLCDEPLFYFGDDESRCFNQCFLAPSQRWKSVTLLWDLGADIPMW